MSETVTILLKKYATKSSNTAISLDKKINIKSLISKVDRVVDEESKKKLLSLEISDLNFWDFGVNATEHLTQGHIVAILCDEYLYFGRILRIISDKNGCIGDAIGWAKMFKQPWRNVVLFGDLQVFRKIPPEAMKAINEVLQSSTTKELTANFYKITETEKFKLALGVDIKKKVLAHSTNIIRKSINPPAKQIETIQVAPTEKRFNLIREDFFVIEVAKRVIRHFLKHPNLEPNQVVSLIKALYALERLPYVTPGIYSEFGVAYRTGSDDFYVLRHIEFRITELDFELSRNKIVFEKDIGSHSFSEPGWYFNLKGEGSDEYHLNSIEEEILEYLNLGARIVVVNNLDFKFDTLGEILRNYFNFIDARLERQNSELKTLNSTSRSLLKSERTECEVIRNNFLKMACKH